MQTASGLEFSTASGSHQSTKMTAIKLNDDKEPWISGRAEVYGIVSGVHPTLDKPELYVVDMPYLDYSGKNYYPNQIVIHWEMLRFNVANVTLFEKDSNTNYKDLIKVLVTAVGAGVALAGGDYAIAPKVAEIANVLISAMPDSWFTNDDDYVDSFYTLEKGKNYSNYYGAGGNARVSLVDYFYYDN